MESGEGLSTTISAAAAAAASSAASTADLCVDSPPLVGSSDDGILVDLPPSDDDLEHERDNGDDHNKDQGDHRGDDGVLTDDLKQKIIRQVEYYFSDENLPTDKYLLNVMKKDKEGFVPVSKIATFRRMKRLTQDCNAIVSALKKSSLLVVSPDGRKVKRLNPLPEVRDPKLFTVLVENLPEDPSEESIRKIFGEAGNIKSVSIRDPRATEELEKGGKKEMLISRNRIHAFVEYETVEAAEKAAATLNNEQDWRNGLRVKLLTQGKYGQRRQTRREVNIEKNSTSRAHEYSGGEESKKASEHQHHHDMPDEDDGGHHPKDKNGHRGRGRGRARRQNYHHGNNGVGHGTTPSSSSHHHHPVELSKPPPGPRMPDGTRGFTMGRGRHPPASVQAQHEV